MRSPTSKLPHSCTPPALTSPTSPKQSHMAPSEDLEVSHDHIRLVQHLIERCLLFYMDRDECCKALARFARVKPVITLTVWKELEIANKEFFVAYLKHREGRQARARSSLQGQLRPTQRRLRQ